MTRASYPQPGLPIPATLASGQYAYYALRVSGASPGDLTFAATPLAGAPAVYGALWPNPVKHLSFRPSASGNYSHSSTGSSVGVLTVPGSQVWRRGRMRMGGRTCPDGPRLAGAAAREGGGMRLAPQLHFLVPSPPPSRWPPARPS